VGVEGKLGGQASVPGAAGTWKALTDNVNQLAANLTTQVRAIAEVATAVTQGDLTRSIQVQAQGEVEELKNNINEMIRNLKETTLKNTEQDWLKTNLAKFTRMLQGQKDLLTVGKLILSELAPTVSAQHGVFYTMEDGPSEDQRLRLLASYAYRERKNVNSEFRLGEGLVGQAALEKERILLTSVPDDYIQVSSGLGEAPPENIVVLPVTFEGEVKAVVELASFNRFSNTHLAFLEQLTESIGIVLNTIEANTRTERLLEQSQSLAKELQSQQDELQQTNEELEEKARLLAQQNVEVERKNREVEQARQALEEKARQLALTSKYKSEFLASMSHELRTPLNSLLMLAHQLSENHEGNLTAKQVEFVKTIYGSGNDLLVLINDILDLSKIESGTVTVEVSDVSFPDLKEFVDRTFRHVAEAKGLQFTLQLDDALPSAIHTDAKRLQQILKNLLSNAFKFTEKGGVALQMGVAKRGWSPENESLNGAGTVACFAVIDSGIGIQPDKQQIIFEAFQQAQGGTARKFGGTGLGLAISRELARLLGGEIHLKSTPGEGSTFTLYLPLTYRPVRTPRREARPSVDETTALSFPQVAGPAAPVEALPSWAVEIPDDRAAIYPGERVLLVVEDDSAFARFLVDMGHEKGFKVVVAARGTIALNLAKELKPDAVTLDLSLPDLDGWKVLDRLKDDPETRHIAVYVISITDEPERALRQGALAFLTKPVPKELLSEALGALKEFVDREVRTLLLVEDDEAQRRAVVELVGGEDVQVTEVGTGRDALAAVQGRHFDCMVLDLGLPDMSGLEVLSEMKKQSGARSRPRVPVIVYTAKDLTRKDETQLKKLAQTIIVKDVRSPERLLDEVALFLHRPTARLPESKRDIVVKLHQTDSGVLAGRKVLVVDDDIRNVFALTSVLERHKMDVQSAESGKAALDLLEKDPGVDIVLMDIMLPEMDGYDTIRAIRRFPHFRSLPIIALTAKAMKGDREKCIEAGASDYIAKPVDTEQLLTLLRVWLYR
jgi:CheY-like chemotaxis protein/signal transduction histidine kinase/HAMP domain-containing protein